LIDHRTAQLQKVILGKEPQLITCHFSIQRQGQVGVIKLPFAKQAGWIRHGCERVHIIIVGGGSICGWLI
jgi:hypothetical protein